MPRGRPETVTAVEVPLSDQAPMTWPSRWTRSVWEVNGEPFDDPGRHDAFRRVPFLVARRLVAAPGTDAVGTVVVVVVGAAVVVVVGAAVVVVVGAAVVVVVGAAVVVVVTTPPGPGSTYSSRFGEFVPALPTTPVVADETNVAATCAGVRAGVWDNSTAAAPATWGEAIDVPEIVLMPPESQVDVIETPGANTSRQEP